MADPIEGINVIGVQFRRAGKIYDFAATETELRVGDDVVVDTDRGASLAKVAQVKFMPKKAFAGTELKPIIRKASEHDLRPPVDSLTPEYIIKYTRDKTERLKLDMRLLQADIQFGGNKVIIYFSAPGRVDFRDLVKDLAGGLKARVELKQVGARDETKLLGGLGICGREYCCSSFLRDFVPVSIKMAKNQNLALNPTKVSGGCGRLLCCLTYENDLYSELRKMLPPRGTMVRNFDGESGRIFKTDILNQSVAFETAEGKAITSKITEVEILERGRDDGSGGGSDDDANTEGWGDDIDVGALTDAQNANKPKGPQRK